MIGLPPWLRRKPKPLDMDRFGWRAKPLDYDFIVRVRADAEFEKEALKVGRKVTDEAFTTWGGLTLADVLSGRTKDMPIMYLRARSAITMFAHELRHVTEKHFHD